MEIHRCPVRKWSTWSGGFSIAMFVSFTGRYLRLSVHELPQNDKLIGVDPAKESTFKKMEKQNCTKTMETGLNNMFSSFLGVTWTDLRILRNSKEGHLGNPERPFGTPRGGHCWLGWPAAKMPAGRGAPSGPSHWNGDSKAWWTMGNYGELV